MQRLLTLYIILSITFEKPIFDPIDQEKLEIEFYNYQDFEEIEVYDYEEDNETCVLEVGHDYEKCHKE